MIVVVGRVSTDAEKRGALIRAGQALAAASRAETGCISYRLYEDTENSNALVFIEEWETDEALQLHFKTAHIAAFMQAVPATLVALPEVRFHDVARSRDLSDVSG
jgi:quinol monooxygenase YgiN